MFGDILAERVPVIVARFVLWSILSSGLHQDPTVSAAQRDSIELGRTVVITRAMASSPWPAVTVYRLVDATPEEAAATFIDYASHETYVPGVKESRVSRVIDPATVEVDYELRVPIVSDERYTVRDHVSAIGDSAYRVDWVLLRATSTKATRGHVVFTPWMNRRTGRAATLMEYYDFVTPGSRMAGIGVIRRHAMREVEESAVAIAKRVEALRHDRAAMRVRVDALHKALMP